MSIFNDIEYSTEDNQQTCLANAREVTEYAKQFKLAQLGETRRDHTWNPLSDNSDQAQSSFVDIRFQENHISRQTTKKEHVLQ